MRLIPFLFLCAKSPIKLGILAGTEQKQDHPRERNFEHFHHPSIEPTAKQKGERFIPVKGRRKVKQLQEGVVITKLAKVRGRKKGVGNRPDPAKADGKRLKNRNKLKRKILKLLEVGVSPDLITDVMLARVLEVSPKTISRWRGGVSLATLIQETPGTRF